MTPSTHGFFSRGAPILGAGLVVAALGTLIFTLSARDRAARAGAEPLVALRGAPIRSAVSKPAAPEAVQSAAALDAKPKPEKASEFEEIEFAQLSGFDYQKSGSFQVAPAATQAPDQAAPAVPPQQTKLPADVRALDGKRVRITGFMNPVEFDRDGVKSFALTSIPGGCCFAAIPRLNEWVVVSMPEGQLAEYAYYDPVTIFGTLSVGELYEDGVILSLYRMTPDKLDIGD